MQLGDVGSDVEQWRSVLSDDGYELNGEPRTFNASVHNATLAWQKAHGLRGDGVVGPKTRAALNAPVVPRPPPRFDPDAIPYVEAVHWSRHLPAGPKSVIVLHCMEWPETATSAEWCAGFFAGKQGAAPRASAHYCVDDESVICSVPPDRIAWHAPGANTSGIGIEHAGYARQSRAQWLDDYSLRMLLLSAELTGWLCKRFAIPVQFIMADHLKRGARGITTHAEVSRAFGKSTHFDPGPFFPITDYIRFIVEAGQQR
jgi:hypothetical protein